VHLKNNYDNSKRRFKNQYLLLNILKKKINFRREHLNNYINYKYIHLRKQYEIVKLKMNVSIENDFIGFNNSEY
jgi:hypothetical protein